ncbi:MAG TPA: hypothetical protein VFU38_00440 [Candidatus Krumholzibacteria bacterium]|nr:hypothetical protein [Candidatus Krumholzibacteria bacterium]
MRGIYRNWILVLAAGAVAAGCSDELSGPSSPTTVAAFKKAASEIPAFPGVDAFVDGIDNPYLAYEPGRVFHYEGETDEGIETIVVEVTNQKKTVMGVDVTVVRDRVYLDGELIEDTDDWFAQDEDGNVWYFGEDSKEIEDGEVVSTEGSWEAGINGNPGIIMLAAPYRGAQYAQEEAPGIAEDMARVKSLDASVEVEYGTFDGCLQITEWTPLEPGPREDKFYKAGLGLVLERGRGGERVELVEIE